MCMFTRPVIQVTGTNIFARLTPASSQFLVYEMAYESETPNAMILPLPVAADSGEDAVQFHSLRDYPNFFEDLDEGFPFRGGFSIGCGGSGEMMIASTGLAVHEVGDYIASFVPTIGDFSRLDPQFTFSETTWDLLPEYMHPVESFDHTLYLQHAGFDSVIGAYANYNVADKATGFVRSDRPAHQFTDVEAGEGTLVPDLLLHRTVMQGDFPNQDQIFAVAGHPLISSFNWRSYRPFLPWVLAAGGLAWFIRRRERIRSSS